MVLLQRAWFLAAPFAVAAVLAGCGGGGGGSGSPPVRPQGTPTVSPSNVKITAVASPATVVVSEPGYGGGFTVNAAPCAGIASVAPAATPGSYTITGIASGSCAITFSDTFGQAVAVPVTVTTSVVVAR